MKSGQLSSCEYINVESEFAAMSVAIGASVTGARAYTATSSQGFLFMVEAVYNAAGLGLPIVITLANRALGAPINIWNDQSNSMSQRRLRLAPALRRKQPGGRRPAHPGVQDRRDALAPGDGVHGRLHPHPRLRAGRPALPESGSTASSRASRHARSSTPTTRSRSGRWWAPEAFTEVRYLAHVRQLEALHVIPQVAAEFHATFGRNSGGLVRGYHLADAETVVVALGSVLGTIKDTIDEQRERGVRIGALGISAFRPFPADEVRLSLGSARRVVVVERALARASGGSSPTRSASPWRASDRR